MAVSGLILALTSDPTWPAALVTIVAAALDFATRLNPLWMLLALAGGCLGFAGVICGKSVGRFAGPASGPSKNGTGDKPVRGSEINE